MTGKVKKDWFSQGVATGLRAIAVGVCFCTMGTAALLADTLVLKSGSVFRNVKVVPRKTAQLIVFQSGRVMRIHNSRVKRVDIKPVRWKRGGISKKRVAEIVRKAIVRETERVRHEMLQQIVKKKRVAREAGLRAWQEARYERLGRSALVPGWGQYRAGATTRAALFLTGSVVLFGSYWNRRVSHGRAQDEFDDRTVPALIPFLGTGGIIAGFTIQQERRRKLFDLEAKTNRAALLLGILYAWNLIDAWWFAGRPDIGKLSISIVPDSVQFSWRIRL